MDDTTLMRTWIVEALDARGGAADAIEVARHVWQQHRDVVEASADLVLTWQLDLHAAAEQMAAAGSLTVDGDRWTLGDVPAPPRVPSGRWDEAEIAVAVQAYVTMLHDGADGRPVGRAAAVGTVSEATGRSASAVEQVFANISAVVQELGYEFVGAFAPRSNVPPGVRPAVREALGVDD